jgi:hypothetical protein
VTFYARQQRPAHLSADDGNAVLKATVRDEDE